MLTHLPAANDIRGLRPVTPELLRAEETARRWRGLPNDASKGQLLQLLEDVHPRAMGVSKGARNYLHWLVKMQPAACFVRTADVKGAAALQQGLALVSTYQDAYVSAALDISVRSLARWRAELAAAGWIAFRDAPDRSRFRQGPAEAPQEAFGVDLRPLVVRYD
ncbi:helix-turn-helix domain-containing protein, partial [Brevundimonas sp.]|uniref:helix-turn-helix domain-containing protein n=1 Tax=Brevundimonas sp. TaxID=1871086 RepID=UPI0027EE56C7